MLVRKSYRATECNLAEDWFWVSPVIGDLLQSKGLQIQQTGETMPTARSLTLLALISIGACLLLDSAAGFSTVGRPVYMLAGFDASAATHLIKNPSPIWNFIRDNANSQWAESSAFSIFFVLHDSAYVIFYFTAFALFLKSLGRSNKRRYAT